MFRIECFCDDAKLPKIKWALYELGAYNVTDMPVKDTKPNGHTEPRAKKVTLAELAQQFVSYAKKRKLKEIDARQVREFVGSIGMREDGYSHALWKLKTLGAVTKVPGKGSFDTKWRVTLSKIRMPKAAGARTS